MTPEQFVYWLQGFAEVARWHPTVEQWQIIRDHLNLVFKKETPKREKSDLEKWLDKEDAAKKPCPTIPPAYPMPNGPTGPWLGGPPVVTC
jgi:hypothetical protein